MEPRANSRIEFINTLSNGAIDGVFAIYRTFESVETTGRIDAEVISLLPRSVKFICHNGKSRWPDSEICVAFKSCVVLCTLKCLLNSQGAGYDQVDVHACTKRGIKVSNTPGVVDSCTADTAMFLILGALRRLNLPMTTLREGRWRGCPLPPMGHNPQTKTLGILGMGGIGQTLRRRAEAFGMQIVYYNRRRLSQERAGTASYVTFNELLARSDVISVNLPLNVSREHFVAAHRIRTSRLY